MIAVEQNTGLTLIVKIGSKVYPAYYMPASFKLFLKAFFDVLCCIFEVGDLIFDHLHVNVFGNHQCILSHVYFHVTEFDIS